MPQKETLSALSVSAGFNPCLLLSLRPCLNLCPLSSSRLLRRWIFVWLGQATVESMCISTARTHLHSFEFLRSCWNSVEEPAHSFVSALLYTVRMQDTSKVASCCRCPLATPPYSDLFPCSQSAFAIQSRTHLFIHRHDLA